MSTTNNNKSRPSSRSINSTSSGGSGIRTIPRDRIGPMRRPTPMQPPPPAPPHPPARAFQQSQQLPTRLRGTSSSSMAPSSGGSRYRMTLRQSLPKFINGVSKDSNVAAATNAGDISAAGSGGSASSAYSRERRPLLLNNNNNNNNRNSDILSYASKSTLTNDNRSISYGGLHLSNTMTVRIATLFCLLSCLCVYQWLATSTIDLAHDVAAPKEYDTIDQSKDVRTHVSDGRNRKYRENYAATTGKNKQTAFYPKISRNADGSVSSIENREHEDVDEMTISKQQQQEQEEENQNEIQEILQDTKEDEDDVAIRNKILEMAKLKEEEHAAGLLRGSDGSTKTGTTNADANDRNDNNNNNLDVSLPVGVDQQSEAQKENEEIIDAEKSLLDASLAKVKAALDNNENEDDNENNNKENAAPAPQSAITTPKATVAYVLPIYSCYDPKSNFNTNDPYDDATFHDAALLLKQSIHIHSISNAPQSQSLYDYQMVAIMESSVVTCTPKDKEGSVIPDQEGLNRADILKNLGYDVFIKDAPISNKEITNEFFKLSVSKNGCCGTKELVRLYAYELENYPIVTMIDFSTMLLKKPDDIYNLILDGGSDDVVPEYMKQSDVWVKDRLNSSIGDKHEIVTMETMPEKIDVVFTRDFTTVMKGRWSTGVNLGFFVIRPSKQTFQELLALYKKGDYDADHGWGGKGYGTYLGSMLTKGLLTYYYHEIQTTNTAVELHRCKYQNLAETPTVRLEKNNRLCRDAKETIDTCTDCRKTPFADIVVANAKVCRPAWACHYHHPNVDSRVCHGMHKSWFQMRKDLEDDANSIYSPTRRNGKWYPEHFLGYCVGGQKGNYIPMEIGKKDN